MSSEPSTLPWLTTVLVLAFLALSASNSVHRRTRSGTW